LNHLTKQQQETAVIAMEEMAELTQVLSKLIRFGYTPDKDDRLIQEMGDVRLMIELLHDTFGVLTNDTYDAMMRKRNKLMKWSSLYE
jgi:hypothetical protein|tara:strand:+ start:3231 stop:3491 length:261 start_codon:yes stop_codon:yes gene_type:complete